MDTKEMLTRRDALFADITMRATNGERRGYWCLSHRDAIMTFKEYVAWLDLHLPMPKPRPSAWWAARRSTCSVDFAGGGHIRFVIATFQADGIKAHYFDDEILLTDCE